MLLDIMLLEQLSVRAMRCPFRLRRPFFPEIWFPPKRYHTPARKFVTAL